MDFNIGISSVQAEIELSLFRFVKTKGLSPILAVYAKHCEGAG
jgi:hypothetical protein